MLDENEITEGMSSEELDALTLGEDAPVETEDTEDKSTDDTQAAEDALKVAEEETSTEESIEDKVDPKDAVIGDFRRKARDLEIDNARLQGELEARKELGIQTKTQEAPKSPLEIAEAAYIEENGDIDGFAMSGTLYREQKAFDDAISKTEQAEAATNQASTTMETTAAQLQSGDFSPENVGDGLDLQSMCKMGDKYLTRGDNLDLADIQAKQGTDVALREAYSIMQRRILASGTEDAKTLQNAIDAKSKSQPKPKIETEKLDVDELITSEDDDTSTGQVDDGSHSDRITNFMFG